MNVREENIFAPLIEKCGIVLLDGAMATELEFAGHNLNHPFWSGKLVETNPEEIKRVHQSYLKAGADCITTSSYQISLEGGKKLGYSEFEIKGLLLKSVALAAEAIDSHYAQVGRDKKPLIAASAGPYGAFLCDGSEYSGSYDISVRKLMSFHIQRWEILTSSNADLIAFETIPNMYEAEALRRLAEDFPDKPIIISFCCRDHRHLSDGTSIVEAIQLFRDIPHVVALGANCTHPKNISPLIASMAPSIVDQEIIVYPNSGEIYDGAQRSWHTPTDLIPIHHLANDWRADGARIMGGCCRVRPHHISEMRKHFPPKSISDHTPEEN